MTYHLAFAVAASSVITACGEPMEIAEPGEPLWQVPAEGAKTAPAVIGGVIILGTLDGFAMALDRFTGQKVWRRQLAQGEVRGRTVHTAGGQALVPHYELWALDPTSGAVSWRFGGLDGAAGYRDPAVSGDTIFTASPLGHAASLDAVTGQPYWEVDVEASLFTPALSPDLVIYATRGYFGSEPRTGPLGAGHVVALRREDGSEAWRFELPDSIGWSLSGGAVSGGAIWDDRLVVGGKSAWIYALQLTNGELLWKHPNGRSPPIGGYIARPVALGSVVVVPQANGVVDAWDSEGGQKLWSWEVPTGSLPVTVGDVLYTFNGMITVGDASGTVLWQAGGHTAYGGTSYFEGNVGPEGTIYTLGVEHFASGGGTFVYAIAPPVIPSGLE